VGASYRPVFAAAEEADVLLAVQAGVRLPVAAPQAGVREPAAKASKPPPLPPPLPESKGVRAPLFQAGVRPPPIAPPYAVRAPSAFQAGVREPLAAEPPQAGARVC
jgi:hypothetical protein